MILEVEGFDKGKQKKVTIKGQTISKVTFHLNVTSPQNERKIVTQTWPEVKSRLVWHLLGEVTLWNRLSFNEKRYLLNQTHLKNN